MKLNSKFDLKTNTPQQGAQCGLWLNITPQDVADALEAGTGPGVPGDNGTPEQGTWEGGHIVEMNDEGNWVLATPCDLSADMPKLYLCVFAGNNDFSFEGSVFGFLGGRFETTKYDAGSYTPGRPLVVSGATDGNLAQKAAFDDNIKHLAYVGPRGQRAMGQVQVLDVIMPQTV